MGRPSRIDCAWAHDRPRVSGDVVVVADGHVLL
jgi:predicted PhzF superfamily epimerase YddE/YHI9